MTSKQENHFTLSRGNDGNNRPHVILRIFSSSATLQQTTFSKYFLTVPKLHISNHICFGMYQKLSYRSSYLCIKMAHHTDMEVQCYVFLHRHKVEANCPIHVLAAKPRVT
jgi:hypothetical protein